jgi:phage tail-like protein
MSAYSSVTSTYLRYLPAVYGTTEPEFLAQYLKVFEKILTGIEDDQLNGRKGIQELLNAEVIGNLFYPRLSFLFDPADTSFIPPISGAPAKQQAAILTELNSYIGVPETSDPLAAYLVTQPTTQPTAQLPTQKSASDPQAAISSWLNDFLVWLGGWVDLLVDNSWSIDKKRNVTAQIMALYRMRGTTQGLGFLVDLLLDLPLQLQHSSSDSDGNTVIVKEPITLTINNPVLPGIFASDSVKNVSYPAYILQDSYQAQPPAKTLAEVPKQQPGPVLSAYLPWLFSVEIALPNLLDPGFVLNANDVTTIQKLVVQLRRLLTSIKPAASNFMITIQPSMQLLDGGVATQLDVNTLLGDRIT